MLGHPYLHTMKKMHGLMQELPEGCYWQHANFDSMLQLVSYAARNGGYHPDPDVPIQIQPSVSAFETLRARLEERWAVGL